MRTWSVEQLEQFVGTIEADRLRGLWVLEAFTGMRRGELVGLRWDDVDLDADQAAELTDGAQLGHKAERLPALMRRFALRGSGLGLQGHVESHLA